MDFAVCPSCRQSVLDDDAVDCPFCGASMKGKPGSKPAPAAKTATTTATPKAVAGKPAAGKPPAVKPTLPGDDLPFESELTTGKPAIPTMPSPTKQRTWQVICPMCDTPGYLPPSAAGQNVRCANPKCVMPVFTAPVEKKQEAPPPPPPPKKSNLPVILGAAGIAVLIFGVGLFLAFFPLGKPKQKVLSEEEKQLLAEMAGGNKTNPANTKNGANPLQPGNAAPGTKVEKGDDTEKGSVATQDLIKAVLKQMKDSALASEKQRSKPYCRQLAAEANAVTGNATAAREHLEQLIKVGSEVSYYRIIPLLDLFWSEFGAGDQKTAAKTLSTALTEVPKLPKFGRTRFEIVGRLIAALAASGRIPEGLEILSKYQSSDADAELAARLQFAIDGRVSMLSDSDSVLPWKYPQAAAATRSLITRGQLAAAASWAAAQPTDEAKSECLAVWAQEVARQKASVGEADDNGAISAAIEKLAPPFAARVWARAGYGRFLAKDPAGMAKAIELAKEKLSPISPPAELNMPPIKETVRYKLPDSVPLFQAATAAGELAFVQAQTAETIGDAEKSLDLALSFARGTAPTLAAAQQRQDDADRQGAGLRAMLKKELNLKSDDDARTASNNYKRSLGEIVEAAQQKFAIETQLLSGLRGAGVGLNSKVWIIVNSRTTADDVNRRDNFFATSLPGDLVEGLKGTDEERAILGAWSVRSNQSAPPRPPFVEFTDLLKKNLPKAIEFVQSIDNKSGRREEILLQTAMVLPTKDQLPLTFQMIARLEDDVIREECYRLASASAAAKGQAETVWNQVSQVARQTEKVAICRGLIAGMQAQGHGATAQ
jgi:hypothetical protein